MGKSEDSRDTLLSWKGVSVGPFCLFWTVWNARNKIVFKDETFSLQRENAFFVFLLWLE